MPVLAGLVSLMGILDHYRGRRILLTGFGGAPASDLYHLDPSTRETSEPFGLFPVHLHFDSWTELMVTPPIVPLPGVALSSGGRNVPAFLLLHATCSSLLTGLAQTAPRLAVGPRLTTLMLAAMRQKPARHSGGRDGSVTGHPTQAAPAGIVNYR